MTQSTILPNKLRHSWQFQAIGTEWSIETAEPLGELQDEITKRIEIFDRTYSRFRDDSLVAQVSRSAGEYHFPSDVLQMIELYRSLYNATDGAMTPLVGSALVESGYDKDYSFKPGRIHDISAWDDVMKWHGAAVDMKVPVVLDFGAAGKGYLVDIVADLLNKNGHDIYVIDASGDVCVRGMSQTIGLEHPDDPSRVVGVATVSNVSLCASATNRRVWGEWHHVINARTAKSVDTIVATWVVADSTMIADGIATALFFVDPDKLSQWNFEYVRMDKHGRIDKSAGFVGELFA